MTVTINIRTGDAAMGSVTCDICHLTVGGKRNLAGKFVKYCMPAALGLISAVCIKIAVVVAPCAAGGNFW